MIRLWNTHFRVLDPLAALLLSVALYLGVLSREPKPIDGAAFYGTLAGVFGSLLGFAIAALTIVMSFLGEPRSRPVRESGHAGTLLQTFVMCCVYCSAALLVAVGGLIVEMLGHGKPWIVALAVFAVLAASASVMRCVRLLYLAGRIIVAAPLQ